MRLIKRLCLAAVTALAAMAFVGATSASANTNTQLCKTHTALTCSNAASILGMTNVGATIILNNVVNILCLKLSLTGNVLSLGNPQQIHTTSVQLQNCGTNAAHTNCEIEMTELPLANFLKTGLDQGTLTLANGRKFLFCENVVLGIDLECEYDDTGITLAAGAQHLTATETPMTEIGSDFLCPDEPTLDALMATTSNAYILQ